MEKIKTIAKKWGNSLGIILPRKIVNAEKIGEGAEITILLEPQHKTTVSDLFKFAEKQKLRRLNKNTKQIMDEIDKELWSEN